MEHSSPSAAALILGVSINAFLLSSRHTKNDNFRVRDLEPGAPFHAINIALHLAVKGGRFPRNSGIASKML